MVVCKHLDLKSDPSDGSDPNDPEFYWWCSKLEKWVDHKDCTIIPCRGEALNGCEDADYPDYFKKYGYEMSSTKPCVVEAEE